MTSDVGSLLIPSHPIGRAVAPPAFAEAAGAAYRGPQARLVLDVDATLPHPPSMSSLTSTVAIVTSIAGSIVLSIVATGVAGAGLRAAWRRVRHGRTDQARMAPPPEPDRLARIERAVDAIGVEVERIAKGQRLLARALEERRGARKETEPR